MKKTIVFDKIARQALMRGIDTLADAVSSTLGPRGRNVIVKHSYDVPFSTHDGVTVAKEVFVNDPTEQAGVELVREAATKTNELAGDGTTTATILARSIIKAGLELIDSGVNPQVLKQDIETATVKVLHKLKAMASPVKTKEEILQIATISASSKELGKTVADAVELAGEDGVIRLNEVPTTEIRVEKLNGMEVESGWMSPYFITDDKNNAVVANPYILITDEKVDAASLIKILDLLPTKDLVVIADDLTPEALAILVANKLDIKSGYHFLSLRAPAYGTLRTDLLQDICAITGATLISSQSGRTLDSVDLMDLGHAGRVESTQTSTFIIDGGGMETIVNERKEQLKSRVSESKEEFEKDFLLKRIAKLSNGVVVINVGAKTILEMREKKYRIEDAVNATKAAKEEGIVAGGETALIRAAIWSENEGAKILHDSLYEPHKKLLENAGIDSNYKIKEGDNLGIDVTDGKVKDLLEAGIVDPVKVTLSALQNASSIACEVLISQVVIVDVPDEK